MSFVNTTSAFGGACARAATPATNAEKPIFAAAASVAVIVAKNDGETRF